MRIFLIVLTVLCVLVSAGMGFMIANENVGGGEGAKKLAEVEKLAETLEGEDNAPAEVMALVKDARGYKRSGWGGAVVGGLALLLLIVTFVKKPTALTAVAGLTVLAAVAFVVLSPSLETAGENGPASPRVQALVYGAAAILAALCSMGADKVRRNRELVAA